MSINSEQHLLVHRRLKAPLFTCSFVGSLYRYSHLSVIIEVACALNYCSLVFTVFQISLTSSRTVHIPRVLTTRTVLVSEITSISYLTRRIEAYFLYLNLSLYTRTVHRLYRTLVQY